ncbi:MAG: putative capsular polysaccharide synthesis family protein [Fibromonadales bacterium]|nr:putative capsular polysaccharide synthesis family protein [Fibromonadales bacterium]
MKINVDSLDLIDNAGFLFENKVILYGAGLCGRDACRILKRAGVSVSYFCDNDSNKWGHHVGDVEVISPNKLKELDKEEKILIIISSYNVSFIDQIIEVIEGLNMRVNKIYTKTVLDISLKRNIKDGRFSELHRNAYLLTNKLKGNIAASGISSTLVSMAISAMEEAHNVLVYQPGKVGSLTVCNSIRKIGIPCAHIHLFNLSNNEDLNVYRNIFKKYDTIKIVTLVREPVSNLYSRLFYVLYAISDSNFSYQFFESRNSLEDAIIEGLKSMNPINFMFDWFDSELKAVFDVDIYAHPFDREKGYSIIKQGNVEVLAMKLEKLNSLESVIGEFIGAPEFKLINTNEADCRLDKYLYNNIKKTIKIPQEIFDQYYKNNPKMDHFYSEEEKVQFLKKWER